MDNPNLLNCLLLTRNTLPLSSTLPIFIYLAPLLALYPPPLFFLRPIYLSYSIPHSSFFPFSSSLHLSFSLPLFLPLLFSPLSLPSSLPLPFLSYSSLPLIRLSSYLPAIEAFSLNPTLHYTSYSSIFLSLSILSSLFIPQPLFLHPCPPSHPSLRFSTKRITMYFNCYYNCMLLMQLFPAPQATSTWRQGVSGLGGRKRMGRESPPVGRPHTKLYPTDVILSSSHAKKLAVYFISTARVYFHKGEGVNGQSYDYKILFRCSICL